MTGSSAMQIDDGAAAEEAAKEEISLNDVKKNLTIIVRATESNQRRMILRAVRNTTRIRKKITCSVLRKAVTTFVSSENDIKSLMISTLDSLSNRSNKSGNSTEAGSSMDIVDQTSDYTVNSKEKWESKLSLAATEVEAYISLLALSVAIRHKDFEGSIKLSTVLIPWVYAFNRRTLEFFSSKIVFYHCLAHEKVGRITDTRSLLLSLHRTCCLRHDEIGQAVILNLLLRNLISRNMLDQAYKHASKTNFPESSSNNQFCRFLYYTGRIGALQLDYTEAHTKLAQCLRKTPQNTALSFRVACQKLMIIVQLLMGEVPERAMFNTQGMRTALVPYLNLTQAVRLGDLTRFSATIEKVDRTYTLIQRLAHNVIKTGLRKINLAYSRISIANICEKVKLDSVIGAEFICAKAIKDGIIDAYIESIPDGSGRCLTSREQGDLYASDEPQKAFHRRIDFCLDVHNEAVRAMRYPQDAYKLDLERAHRTGLQDDRTEEELAREIEDEMDDDDI